MSGAAGRLVGRRAVVTGASRGIGAGIVERLAAEGADVVAVARTLEQHDHLPGSLQETVQRGSRYGTKVLALTADLAAEDDRDGLIGRAAEMLDGPIDILVNNAAAAMYHSMADFPLKRRRLTFEVNVHAPLDLAQQALPDMIESGAGWIVNVSSATANLRQGPPFELPPPGTAMAIYGASKAALNRLTNGLGAELYGAGVRVNTIEPRFGVLTEGAAALVGDSYSADIFESMEEMVEGVLVLCDCAPELTGQVTVSLDLLEENSILARGLDGQIREAVR
ncbi:SDR family NAD(P)-dependent oxidoreductase [Nocardioides sp. Bht2]|uniref:SDR family NAD(P)-dependent oxidoreductase n=1 Tax=Nocardioides sp. Bht2 TaxID=3392297 RepID=UPI0039B52D8D